MPKPFLIVEQEILENEMIDTLIAGLKEWRSDLSFPESYSDMQACVRGLMRMFEIKRRPLVVPLKLKCHTCEGLGHLVNKVEGGVKYTSTCETCNGYGYIDG
jgi:hypothetical protein